MSTVSLQLLLANCPNSTISNDGFSRFVDVVMEVEAEGLWLASFHLSFSQEVLRESNVFFCVCFLTWCSDSGHHNRPPFSSAIREIEQLPLSPRNFPLSQMGKQSPPRAHQGHMTSETHGRNSHPQLCNFQISTVFVYALLIVHFFP